MSNRICLLALFSLTLTGCAAAIDVDEGRVVEAVDIERALASIYAGEDTHRAAKTDSFGPLTFLRQHADSAADAWLNYFNAIADEDTRLALLYLAGDTCLDGTLEPIADIVDSALPAASEIAADHVPTPFEVASLRRHAAIGAVGELGSTRCAELGQRGSPNDQALDTLAAWLAASERGVAVSAAEELLDHAPELAARTRADLPGDREALLVPIDDRTFEDDPEAFDDPAAEAKPEREADLGPAPAAVSCAPLEYPTDTSGDAFVSYMIEVAAEFKSEESCTQLASRYDSEFSIQNAAWDDGFGIEEPCNDKLPFKRLVNALWLLENSVHDLNAPGDYSGGVINWGYHYLSAKTGRHELEASCNDDGAYAVTYTGAWCFQPFCDERIEMHLPSFQVPAPIRASILLHEARHGGGYDHNGGSGCRTGSGCDSEYRYRGANTIEVQWSAQYARLGRFKTEFMRRSAIRWANLILQNRYSRCPEKLIHETTGLFYSVPDACGAD